MTDSTMDGLIAAIHKLSATFAPLAKRSALVPVNRVGGDIVGAWSSRGGFTTIAKVEALGLPPPPPPRPTIVSQADDAKIRLQALTEEIRAERPELSDLSAMRLAIATDEGGELFRLMRDPDARFPGVEIDDPNVEEDPPQPERAAPAEEEPTMKSALTSILKGADPNMLAADVVHARLEAVALDIRKADRTLTEAQAYDRALRARPDLWQQHRAAAGRTVAEVRADEERLAKRRAAGFERWDQALDNCAKAIATRDGIPYPDALTKARTEFPDVYRAYSMGLA